MSDASDNKSPPSDVGYRRPPPRTRFKKGQSGNPGGRPRKKGPAVTDMAALLDAPVKLRQGGRAKTVAMKEAQLRAMLKKAMTGDLEAVAYCLQQFDAHGAIAMPELEQGGVIHIPKTMPIGMGTLLVQFFGRPKEKTATGVPIWSADQIAIARERYLASVSDDERNDDLRRGYPDLEQR
ncbi:hypothetical protein SAMN02745157_3712 [Kaistia soli DSM 19436]|uniref:DUF5681 domain-containing protein n=1 Tax=Kaistia soli DSM 19436 TaxID=1122133 RepID=A0A1M5I1U9_9HYPH|nr:DUF5681 domain-containing protein [Kaistia soli]SHG22225.1 hypothetical protein SAMN02745157_3712 [Kaistia soli DSM 19436]